MIAKKTPSPTFDVESSLINKGFKLICGVDEVGRGPLAGPVVAAAVILDPENIPPGLNDSKKISQKKRERLFDDISKSAIISVASLSAATIDKLNIRQATLLAMLRATHSLPKQTDFALIDGRDIPEGLPCPAHALIKGDSRSESIAAASIIAKVTRDNMMREAAQHYPDYGFDRHKGYGTAIHRQMIQEKGPCPLHRRSFEPIKSMITAF